MVPIGEISVLQMLGFCDLYYGFDDAFDFGGRYDWMFRAVSGVSRGGSFGRRHGCAGAVLSELWALLEGAMVALWKTFLTVKAVDSMVRVCRGCDLLLDMVLGDVYSGC